MKFSIGEKVKIVRSEIDHEPISANLGDWRIGMIGEISKLKGSFIGPWDYEIVLNKDGSDLKVYEDELELVQ